MCLFYKWTNLFLLRKWQVFEWAKTEPLTAMFNNEISLKFDTVTCEHQNAYWDMIPSVLTGTAV